MAEAKVIKAAADRMMKIFSERPSEGKATKSTVAEMVDGCTATSRTVNSP